jgi:subtilisin family serine protease
LVLMPSRITPRFRRGPYAIAFLSLICAAAPATAWAAASRPGEGDLSPRLAELAKPSVRSAPPARQAEELSLAPEGPGSLLREGNRILVEVRFERGATAAVDDLRAAGAKIVNVSPRYQTVTVAAKPGELRSLPGVRNVTDASPVLAPIVAASECPAGIAVSQGDAQLHAAEARTSAEVDGSGVTVGILSDSFDKATEAADESGPVETHEAEDVESGDLPGAVNPCGETSKVSVLDDSDSQGEDEGRAMAQIVHDLAPGANLAFASAFTSETAFAKNIELLAKPVGEGGAGANVIADDVTYPTEPFFQEGVVANAVRKVTEAGVSYFTSAANNNLRVGGEDIASWEAPQYRDSSGCPAAIVAYSAQLENAGESGLHPTHCMDFSPGASVDRTFRVTVFPGSTLRLDLQWAEPWEGVTTDLDAFLLGPKGELVARSIEDNVGNSEHPFEFVGWKNNTGVQAKVKLVINRFTGGTPRLKLALLQNGGGVTSTEYETSQGSDIVGPTIFGHNGAEDATSVAAINQAATELPEPYSSRGPVVHYFKPVNGVSAAEPLEPEAILSKPDLTATDCNVTTFFAEFVGTWRFCGTSAAAPHAAGIAALMLQKEPLATPQQIRTAMQESATSIGTFGPCAIGAGLLEATGAIAALVFPGSDTPAVCTPPEPGPIVNEGEFEQPPIVEEGGQVTPVEMPPPEVTPPPPPNPLPQTSLRKRPAKVIQTTLGNATAVFVFGSDEAGATFLCRVDRGLWQNCPARFVRRYRVGKHVVRVVARDAAGNSDPTAVVYGFRVKRIG